MTEKPAPMRILIVQYAGDYREAYRRLKETGAETYYGHAYLLSQLERFQSSFGEVAILCGLTAERYVEKLPNGVTVMGAKAHPKKQFAKLREMMEQWNPTHLVVLGPFASILRWGISTRRRVMCQIADSFNINALLRFVKYGPIASLLNDRRVDWVSNHGANACRSLVEIGVKPDKIIPWDWPYSRRPDQTEPRGLSNAPPTLLYVGTLQPLKGIGDVIHAMAELRKRNIPLTLNIVGGGRTDFYQAMAERCGVSSNVNFLGLKANTEVFDLMKTATAVVVPSRRAYPEGLPLTIYEALCARTPIIASDHPMFAGHLVHRASAMVFRNGDPVSLADRVAELLADPELYRDISERTAATWERMQNDVKWGEIIYRWLSGTPDDQAWLASKALTATPALAPIQPD